MKRFQIVRTGVVLLAAACMSAAAMAQELKVGSKAPSLPVYKWIKGKEVKEFKSDSVYVVEFWATWCGPCKESIPHLTEMAKKYGDKVSFVGVSVYENDPETQKSESEYLPAVEKFVKDMGPKMDYTVAVDTWDGKVAKSWMEAADQDGIPTAFIVDKTGTVVWIGHPMDKLDTTLDKVLDGTYDMQAVIKQEADARKAAEEMEQLMKPVNDAFEAQDLDGAVKAIDDVIAKKPEYEVYLASLKFQTLLSIREKDAYDYARKLKGGLYKEDPMMLNSIAWSMIDPEEPRTSPDYKLALEISDQAVKLMKEDGWDKAMVMDTYALALFKNNKVKEAIDAQTKALAMARKSEDKDEDTLAEMEARLAEFKKKG